jgi:hypothetical protein
VKTCAIIFIVAIFYIQPTVAFAQASPYYTVYRTWAIAPRDTHNAGKIIAFLPRRYLLHVENRHSFDKISGKEYVRATTQDGADVLVLNDSVSRRPYSQSIGRHEVIFNIGFHLCKATGCVTDEDTTFPVQRGDAFEIDATKGQDGFFYLKGSRPDGEFGGYISKEVLSTMEQVGQITRADDPHPRYKIDKFKSELLELSCGEKLEHRDYRKNIRDNDTRVDDPIIIERILQRIPTLGKFSNDKFTASADIGEDNYRHEIYLYQIEDRAVKSEHEFKNFDVAVAVKIRCDSAGYGGKRDKYIEEATLFSQRKAEPIDFSIEEFKTPKDLIQYTGSAYMLSINNESQFNKALERLSRKIEDRTLAGFVLTELNRSCRSKMRRLDSNSACIKYSY